MKRSVSAISVSTVLLVLCLLIPKSSTLVLRIQQLRYGAATSVILSSSGQRLSSLFQDLPHIPRFSLKEMHKADGRTYQCGIRNKNDSAAFTSFFKSPVVYAQGFHCPDWNGNCNGTDWQDSDNFCNTGGPCFGAYNDTVTGGPICNGFTYDGTFCGSIPECGCVNYACYVCE